MSGEALRIVGGTGAGSRIPLGADFVVGRAEAGMGNLAGDHEISRHHARFRRTAQGQVLVEDLGSTNGTYVDGTRITGPHVLSHGDQIVLGKTVLEFDSGERPTAAGLTRPRDVVAASPPPTPTSPTLARPPPPPPLPVPTAAQHRLGTRARDVLLPVGLAAAITAGLVIWGKTLTPDYSTSLFGQTATDTFPLKSWLGTALLALAIAQVFTALWLYGKLIRARPRRLGLVHRLTGVTAIVVSLPIAYHCMLAYGFRDFDSRTALHSAAGCFFYGAIAAKIAVVRSKRLPGFALPLAGGTLVTVIAVLWYSAALWYFNDSSVPLLSSASAAPSSPKAAAYTPGAAQVAISMKNIQFAPKAATAKVGQTVVWTNQDSVAHNVTATSGASFRSANFGKGGTYKQTLTAPGKIAYVCTLHPGMDATLTVTR